MPDLPTVDPIATELAAAVAGRYTLERELGRGGMGAVFLARDLRLDRPVAIKVLPPELAIRPELRERFLRETRTAAAFSHPNIVSVHGVEELGSLLFFVMSYVEGETLTQRVRRQGPLTVPDATRLLQEVAWALSYAHARGIVHRDVKPDNILIERATGRALVMDFGIARSVAASGLTQVGETVGTPHFMSPEQVAGDAVDGRSDLYSLGVVAYFAVTGRLPLDAGNAQAVMLAHVSQAPEPVARFRPDLPAPLGGAIDRCLQKDPAQRFATGEALVEALEQVRARRIEVPAQIRVWTARADQFFRNGLLLAILVPQLLNFSGQAARLVITALVLVGAVPALWAQIPIGMRELARQGFGYADLRAGVLAIDAEQQGFQSALRADPRYRRRRRQQALLLLAGFLLAILVTVLAVASGTETAPGLHKVSMPALVLVALSGSLAMVFMVLAIAQLAGSGRLDRRLHRIWTGRLGGFLFRLGAWRLPVAGPVGTTGSASISAFTLIETLDPAVRRRLRSARSLLSRLDGALADLDTRERELDAALADLKAGTAAAGSATFQRQQSLESELDTARQRVAERRAALLSGVEGVRLSLVRLKSRIGTAEETERECEAALKLLELPI
jgi:serine/threonine-protein kinase